MAGAEFAPGTGTICKVSARRPPAPRKAVSSKSGVALRTPERPAPTAAKKPSFGRPPSGQKGRDAAPQTGPQPRPRDRSARTGIERMRTAARTRAGAMQVYTVRMIVLSCVSMLCAVLLLPTFRAAVDQKAQVLTAARRLDANLSEIERLNGELERWQDPAYIESQARNRLSYAMPGDTVWRAVGGIAQTPEAMLADTGGLDVGLLAVPDSVPWFKVLGNSLLSADQFVEPEAPATTSGWNTVVGSTEQPRTGLGGKIG